MNTNAVVSSKNYSNDKYFSYLQSIVQLFLKDIYNLTDHYGSDDTISVISKLLFKQLAGKLIQELIECDDYRKGVELTSYEYLILIEIVKFYQDIKHPSLFKLTESDYQNILEKILI